MLPPESCRGPFAPSSAPFPICSSLRTCAVASTPPTGIAGFSRKGYLENDSSLELLTKITLSHAEAGSDLVAPAAMLDGQIKAMRETLDEHGFVNLPIMAYAVKYASKLYDPFFKEGTHSSLSSGDKRTHQMDWANADEAMREIALDIEEGADIVMVKPALFYLDIVARAKREFAMPLAVYNVSGEYAMIDAAAHLGRLDRDAIMMEALMSMKRAGADLIITYFAMRAAELLDRGVRSAPDVKPTSSFLKKYRRRANKPDAVGSR